MALAITEEHGPCGFTDRKMYGVMCQKLAALLQKIMEIFPALEAVQPQRSGMQALCGLHWALDKAKSFLQQIVYSSKFYLAITSDSVAIKFGKVKEGLAQSLGRLEPNLPEDLAQQVASFVVELQEVTFQPDVMDQEAGNQIISLLQEEKDDPGVNASVEIDVFEQVATNMGITSYKAVLTERKALRRLLDKARSDEDRKKELVVQYLLHLLRKYSKVQKFANTDDGLIPDILSSCPPSPSERGSEASTSGRDSNYSSDLSCFQLNQRRVGHGASSCLSHALISPEEFRCPISLQLMSDPVIISSGQTYERVCIQKWFKEGHDTCPKTQQKLCHLDLTPNYCVKGLIMSWCERHGIPFPTPPSPPPSPVTSWRCSFFSESVSTKSYAQSEIAVSPEHDGIVSKGLVNGAAENEVLLNLPDSESLATRDSCCCMKERYQRRGADLAKAIQLSTELLFSSSLEVQHQAAEDIRVLTKDNAEARLHISNLGSIAALVVFLTASVKAGIENAQETACFALLNAAINNNRNKAEIMRTGAIPLLVKLLNPEISLVVKEAAIVVLLTASCLDENKPGIGSSGAVPFLVEHLDSGSAQGVKDALTTLFNLSIFGGNHDGMVKSGVVLKLIHMLSVGHMDVKEKCAAILYNLSSIDEGRLATVEAEGGLFTLAEVMDGGTHKEKELVVGILLALCINSSEHSQLVLREGVVPSVVMLSVNGSSRAKERSQKLLQHFREERQKEGVWPSSSSCSSFSGPVSSSLADVGKKDSEDNSRKLDTGCFGVKTRSGSFFRKSKSFSFYRC